MKTILSLFTVLLFYTALLLAQNHIDIGLVNAIKQNNIREFKILLSQVDSIDRFIHENLHHDDYNKLTLLGFACAYKRPQMVIKLLQKGAEMQLGVADDYYIYDALYSIYQKEQNNRYNAQIVEILLKKGANPNSIYGDNARSILHIATAQNDEAVVKMLLKQGANPDNAGELGVKYRCYPFIEAVKNNNLALVRLLLKYKANPKVEDENGKTALDYAKENQNSYIIQLLSTIN